MLLCDRDEASQAWTMPTIIEPISGQGITLKNYSVVLLNSCELYLAL